MSRATGRAAVRVLAAGLVGVIAQPAAAQTAREAELEARLAQLEAAVAALRGELAESRRSAVTPPPSAVAQSPAPDKSPALETRVAALEARPVAPTEGFRVGGSTVKLSGFVRVVGTASRWSDGEIPVGSLGREFYLPQQIPVGGGFSSRDVIGHARQTRIALSTDTPLANGKTIGTYVEFDFALAAAPLGAQRATNPYVPTFRRGFIRYGRWLVGQEWSTFQNVGALPETTDFVGPLDGTVFNRQMILQYRQPLNDRLGLFLAAENPQTETVVGAAAALVDNDHDTVPDVVAKLAYAHKGAELTLAGIARQLSARTGGEGDDAFGWGVSAAGKLPFGPNGRHDVRFMATYGNGIGRYLGLGYVPDGVQATPTGTIGVVENFAGFAALKLGWTSTLRSTFSASYQDAGYPDGVPLPALANKSAQSMAANLFWTPVPRLDLGIEYRHAVRETLDGQRGKLDRLEIAVKYPF